MRFRRTLGRDLSFVTATAIGALLSGLATAQAQSNQTFPAPPGGAGFLPIPGTNTSLKVGGYAKLDYQYDESTAQNFTANGVGTAADVAIIPLNDNIRGSAVNPAASIHGNSRLSAAESRFNIETRTPTNYGELKTYIEGDFEGVSGLTPGNTFEFNSDRSAFALRYAYGVLGSLLAGQYLSLFEDPAALVETLDFGGAIGVSGPLRQPQFRYVYSVGNGLTLAASIENPQTLVISTTENNNVNLANGSSTFGFGQGEKAPDFVGAIIFAQGPGHIALRGVVRDLYDHGPGNVANAGAATPAQASTIGWGAGISADLHVFRNDDIIFQVNGGDGIGRYISNAGVSPGDSVISADGHTLKAVWQWGGVLAYRHFWTDNLRSNIEGSVIQASYPTDLFTTTVGGVNPAAPQGALGSLNHRLISTHLNLIWSPVPPVDLGVEQIWEERRTVAGQTGHIFRTQASARFKF